MRTHVEKVEAGMKPAVRLAVRPREALSVVYVAVLAVGALLLCVGIVACGSTEGELAASDGLDRAVGAEETIATGPATHVDLRIDPLVELYFSIRAQAAKRESTPGAGYEKAVAAARALQRQMGSFGGWGPIDAGVFVAADAAELVREFSTLPEPFEMRGRSLSIRDDAVRLATAIDELMPEYLETSWVSRKAVLDERIAELERSFMPLHRDALAYMMDSLGIADPGIGVPMFLVTEINPPGASTYYLDDGVPVGVVGITVGGSEELLKETLLHESAHALDIASTESDDAFDSLRQMLSARGLSRRDRAFRDIPHTLMFIQAEETMRRIYDPDHVGYGVATDLYERLGEPAEVEREIWPRYLRREVTRSEALRSIVEALDPQPAEAPQSQ